MTTHNKTHFTFVTEPLLLFTYNILQIRDLTNRGQYCAYLRNSCGWIFREVNLFALFCPCLTAGKILDNAQHLPTLKAMAHLSSSPADPVTATQSTTVSINNDCIVLISCSAISYSACVLSTGPRLAQQARVITLKKLLPACFVWSVLYHQQNN